eukprot:2002888-Pyramimonas_sp.AAC.1
MVAVMLDDQRRLSLRERPVGARVHESAPWATLAKRKVICTHVIYHCSTGLRDPRGALTRKPAEMMANRRA